MLLVGEALGTDEARIGAPFVGRAGGMLNRLLGKMGIPRDQLRIDNCVRCQPPGDWLDGAPWEAGALAHCSQYLGKTLQEGYGSVVALGGSATRKLLQLPRKPFAINDWHGCPTLDPSGQFYITPTFHPAFLLRGQQRLMGAVMFDLRRALQVAQEGRWVGQPATLVVDPGPARFNAWVEEYFAALATGQEVWLAVDIETTDKLAGADEGELDDSYSNIVRINFAFHPDQGLTVPWEEVYKPGIRRLLAGPGVKCFWNATYDVSRLRAAGFVVAEPVLDFMWAWHVLQSSLPRGLGFAAPFFSRYGAWKHLSGSNPGDYAAIDAVQTLRVAWGVAGKLQEQGQWDVFRRHVYELDTKVLHPATTVGLLADTGRLESFTAKLVGLLAESLSNIQALVPDAVLGLHPKGGWARRPPTGGATVTFKRGEAKVVQDYRDEEILEKEVLAEVQVCQACEAVGVARTHRCKDRALTPQVVKVERPTPRWFVREPFNPGSPTQVLAYVLAKGHKAGRAKKSKSGNPSVDKTTLEKLARTTRDPFYRGILDYRALDKVKGTYAEGAAKRLDSEGRLHSTYTHKPTTLRLSSTNPNLTNVVADRAAKISAGFRECIVAAPGCELLEVDYSAIEAVLSGYFMGDPAFIRLAKLGIHAYHAGAILGKPADLGWSDEDLGKHFKTVKAYDQQVSKGVLQYDKSKRTIYGTLYGMSDMGLHLTYPELFPDKRSAGRNQGILYELCPKLKPWHNELRHRAAKKGFLGGADHPYGYVHWFWDVLYYDAKAGEWVLGTDAKKVVAFYPQSTAAGILKEAVLRMVDPEGRYYVGDAYHGRTPIRALIHDSVLLEVPSAQVDDVLARVVASMRLPVPQLQGLQIGVAAKRGPDWLNMTEVPLGEVGLAAETAVREGEDEEAE